MKPISKPGCYALRAEVYHQDPVRVPSLSRSIAQILLTATPRRAWMHHPRLNPNFKDQRAGKNMDLGSVAHTLMLNDGAPVRVIKAENYKGFAAQRARDVANASGDIPILRADYERVKVMVAAGREQLMCHESAADAFVDGAPEQTLVWKEKIEGRTVWCRARLDWRPPLGGWLNDFKTTAVSTPEAWINRVLYPEGLDLQAAMYKRGYTAVFGVPPAGFRFVVMNIEEPFELFTVVLSNADIDMAGRDLEHAMALWGWCMAENKWPGFQKRDYVARRTGWRERVTLEREDREYSAKAAGEDLRRLMIDWQAPLDRKGKAA